MSFNFKDVVDVVWDIVVNVVEKVLDIVENVGYIICGDIVGGVSGIVKDFIDIVIYVVDRMKEVFIGKMDDEG